MRWFKRISLILIPIVILGTIVFNTHDSKADVELAYCIKSTDEKSYFDVKFYLIDKEGNVITNGYELSVEEGNYDAPDFVFRLQSHKPFFIIGHLIARIKINKTDARINSLEKTFKYSKKIHGKKGLIFIREFDDSVPHLDSPGAIISHRSSHTVEDPWKKSNNCN
jgi:hypothetical protein